MNRHYDEERDNKTLCLGQNRLIASFLDGAFNDIRDRYLGIVHAFLMLSRYLLLPSRDPRDPLCLDPRDPLCLVSARSAPSCFFFRAWLDNDVLPILMMIMGIPDTVVLANDSSGSQCIGQHACTLHVRMCKELHHLSPSLGQEGDKNNDLLQAPHSLQQVLTSAAGGTYDREYDARLDKDKKDKKLGTDNEIKAMYDIIFSVREVRVEEHVTLGNLVDALRGFDDTPILHPLGAWTRDNKHDINNNNAFHANEPTLALFDIAYIHFDGHGHYNFLLPP